MSRKRKETRGERSSNVRRTLIPTASVLPISSTDTLLINHSDGCNVIHRDEMHIFNLLATFAVDGAQICAHVHIAVPVM